MLKVQEIIKPSSFTILLIRAIDLAGFQIVRYSNGGTNPYAAALSGTIQPKSTYVLVLDKRDPNGTGQEVPIAQALEDKADLFLSPVYTV